MSLWVPGIGFLKTMPAVIECFNFSFTNNCSRKLVPFPKIRSMKRKGLLAAFLFLVLCATGQPGNNPAGGPVGGSIKQDLPWSGTFRGSVNGTPSLLHLEQQGSAAKGSIDASGYVYSLAGQVSNGSLNGQLTDTKTGGVMDFKATRQDSEIFLVLLIPGQAGQVTELPLRFSSNAGKLEEAPAADNQNPGSGISRDPALIGGWRHTESYTSGEFSMVSEWYMNIYLDGSYTYGDGQVAGGDASTGFESGGNSGNSRGQWKTENAVVYINEGYGWQPYAKYFIQGSSLMFTFNDGSRQLWERFR